MSVYRVASLLKTETLGLSALHGKILLVVTVARSTFIRYHFITPPSSVARLRNLAASIMG